ncbi:MAG: AMP-binding protein [Calditrichaeota bacterium]|nr:AMP-binding protein [Calditrichota bacterium]
MTSEKQKNEHGGLFPLSELTDHSAADFGNLTVMRIWRNKQYEELTYNELHQRVQAIARWLIEQGVQPDDHIAILGDNSPEWEASYLGIQKAGGIGIPIDRMLPATGIRFLLSESKAKFLFTSTQYLKTLAEVSEVSTLEKTVNFDNDGIADSVNFGEIIADSGDNSIDFPKRSLDDIAVILFTSGTTGHSKGVMLTHRNLLSNLIAASEVYTAGPDDTFLSVLPVHHSFEATAGFLFPIYKGCSITFARGFAGPDLIEDIKATKVTYMLGVPLLYEKMHGGILRGIRKKGKKAERMFKTVYKVVKTLEKLGMNPGQKLFKDLREKAGLSSVRHFLSAGGPLDPEIAVFFNRLGLRLVQGYGLTETSPCTHLTPEDMLRHECVGTPIGDVECMINDANDEGIGEVFVKGTNVFKGYYQNEEATSATFTDDGWFKTGDLGRIHSDGYLQITGRKKAMLVTAGGKNVYPEEIEFHLNRSRFIAESVVSGLQRTKGMGEEVVALIHPDYEQLDLYFTDAKKEKSNDEISTLIQSEIQTAQKSLAAYMHIKQFRIFEDEFQKTTKRTIKRFLYSGKMVLVDDNKDK